MEKSEFLKNLGKRIVELRKEKKITQFDLAAGCNKNRQDLSKIERGLVNPSAFYLYQISRALNVDMADIFKL
jgi:transcriptional regulator with XRE-family HTH domain